MNNKADLTSNKSNKESNKVSNNLSKNVSSDKIADTVDETLTTELSEDMEMVSPGAMLYEARKAQSLTQEHISAKLNFSLNLVKNLENDNFDPKTPVTFIRGYLANYAKVVGVDVEDVLASYDALDAATIQRSEMLSFSKQTSKQAEHSRVMWLSYFIVAVLIGLTILWWQQENSQQTQDDGMALPFAEVVNADEVTEIIEPTESDETEADENLIESETLTDESADSDSESIELTLDGTESQEVLSETINSENVEQVVEATLSTAVFTFTGDCWVNIFDATGERIAWGVKKTGYVMTIEGVAPLRITVGKPELTSIVFDGQPVDMSAFNEGNIAKFNLPLAE